MMVLKKFLSFVAILMPLMATAETYNVEVGQFEKLKINGDINVIYKNLPDSTGYARYEAEPGNNDIFKFSTKGDGTLKVEPNNEKWGKNDLPVLFLYSNFLVSIESFSNLSIDLINVAPCASFNVNQVGNGTITVENLRSNNVSAAISTGNGTIFLSGKCINANFRMVGAGLISADRLVAENVKCRILGTGSIGCWPVDTLNVTGIGSTKIYYKGRPNIKKTGGGKLYELPEDSDSEIPEDAVEVTTFKDNTPAPSPDSEEDDQGPQTIVTADD